MKLEIELVPSTVWYANVRKLVSRQEWDKIRKSAYAENNYKCAICDAGIQLHCHELWEYDDENKVQTLKGFTALCENCHMIKHAGFSMHTPQGKQKYNRAELIEHFCRVNNCSKEDFLKHENQAFGIWEKRSQSQWKQDFGKNLSINP